MYILRQKTSDDDEINQIDDNRMIDASGLWLLLAVTNKKQCQKNNVIYLTIYKQWQLWANIKHVYNNS